MSAIVYVLEIDGLGARGTVAAVVVKLQQRVSDLGPCAIASAFPHQGVGKKLRLDGVGELVGGGCAEVNRGARLREYQYASRPHRSHKFVQLSCHAVTYARVALEDHDESAQGADVRLEKAYGPEASIAVG